jgi:hypothetical protein
MPLFIIFSSHLRSQQRRRLSRTFSKSIGEAFSHIDPLLGSPEENNRRWQRPSGLTSRRHFDQKRKPPNRGGQKERWV